MTRKIDIDGIPAIVWGKDSDKVWLCVHGKMSSKEAFDAFASLAEEKGCQTISFDLPQHGDRKNETTRCDIWNGIHDLSVVGDYAFRQWKEVSLYARSLGAYFSLNAYPTRRFKKCLFQSPILDMEYLIKQMMLWFDITEERLSYEKEIPTPIDLMSWDYYQYVLAHPVQKWDIPTHILFAGKDNMQTLGIVNDFAAQFDCSITVSENSNHSFMDEHDVHVVKQWLHNNI